MVLEELKKDGESVKNLALKIGISRGMTYNHIRELREMGFIAVSYTHLDVYKRQI